MRHGAQVDATSEAEPSTPNLVGQWYLQSRSAHRDARVIEAYRRLQVETDRLFTLLTRGSRHRAVRVVFTRCAQPYESDDELILGVRANGTLEMTSAAAAGERLHPLFDCEFGGAFDRFRAVHDLIGHAGVGTVSISTTSARPGGPKTACTVVSHGPLSLQLYGVNAARNVVGAAPELKSIAPRALDTRADEHDPTEDQCAPPSAPSST